MHFKKKVIMQAFIPAAGIGSRLKPLTDYCPKALIEIGGKTLLEIAIDKLAGLGAKRIVVNVHHHANMMLDFIQQHHWPTEVLISDESDQLMDTGGGLKKAANFFFSNEPILIHNVDILSAIDLKQLEKQHSDSKSIATLAVSQRNSSRKLLFNKQNQLVGWRNDTTGETKWSMQTEKDTCSLSFSGISIVDPLLISLLPTANKPYPIIPAYLEIAKNHRISYFKHDSKSWLDVGKPETLAQAQHFLSQTINK